ncbi:sodium:solute symporter family transporter [Planctomicrobium sp. SH661]|uniref:sodium:solute symporter family transporter n=1 Tax=Planctomicrobium sp. SH661 TaxID=3448124 RepID=UPI003F5C104C
MPEAEISMESGLKFLDFVAIAFYLLLTFGIAVWFGRRQKSSDDFFVGGRHVPWFAVGLSILATLFSTLTYLGTPGEVIKHGFGFYCGYLALPLSMLVVTRFWIPFYMRLGLTSAYEYLELRFNYGLRCVGAGLFILLRLGWMSMVVFAAAMALDRVKGPDLAFLPGADLYWWMAGIGIIAAVYTAVGGIQAQIWTDVLQCVLLLAGTVMVIGAVVMANHTGPASWWATAAEQNTQHLSPPLFSWDLTIRVTIVTAMINQFFWSICTHGSDQVVLQRYFSTASLQSARRSYYINIATELTMVGLLTLCGFALLAFYLQHPEALPAGWTPANSADKLFPHFLSSQLPAGCAGLVISAFLCDAIQTLEAGVNSITAVVTTDFMTHSRRKEKASASLLFVRVLSIVLTLLVSINAFFVAQLALHGGMTIIDMMPKFFNMFIGPLAAMFFIGMFLPRCTGKSVAIAVGLGLLAAIIWNWGRELSLFGSTPTMLLAIAVPCLTTMLSAGLLSLFIENGKPHPGLDFTWAAIVRKPTRTTTNSTAPLTESRHPDEPGVCLAESEVLP